MGGDSTGERRVGVREVRLRVACLVAVEACAVALAYALAARVSIPLGVLAAVVAALGFLRLQHTTRLARSGASSTSTPTVGPSATSVARG